MKVLSRLELPCTSETRTDEVALSKIEPSEMEAVNGGQPIQPRSQKSCRLAGVVAGICLVGLLIGTSARIPNP
jgi:hypothetical protein